MDENRTLPQEPQLTGVRGQGEWLKTIQEAKMAIKLLEAFDQLKRFGESKGWLTHGDAIRVLKHFKAGAANAFLDKLDRLGAFEYLPRPNGEDNQSVFRFTKPAEEKLRAELKSLQDP